MTARAEDLLARLRGEGPLYAILDAARDEEIIELLAAHDDISVSLLDGDDAEELRDQAPHIVQLSPESRLLAELAYEGWGFGWGVFFSSEASLAELRQHLQQFLVAAMPNGEQVEFRFYDPRVLWRFLAACNSDEIRSFFGPIRSYFVEADSSARLAQFTVTHDGMELELVKVSTRRPPTREEDDHVPAP